MKIIFSETKQELAMKAAAHGTELIQQAIDQRGQANITVATGTSQVEMLAKLVNENVDWSKVISFHLDEYIGILISHLASFRKYLKERFVEKVFLGQFHYINGENNPVLECARLGNLINQHPIDVAFVGIGENAHLAFNDPPADFDTEEAFIEVTLDLACRLQQVREGWFSSVDEVPKRAISMSIRQILKSKAIICSVPDSRKAQAVKNVVEGHITSDVPASILKKHLDTTLYLDKYSASLLSQKFN